MRVTTVAIMFYLATGASFVAAQSSSPPPKAAKVEATTAVPDPHSVKQNFDEVDDYIRTSIVRQHVPGLSLVVIRDGKIVKAKGYGLASVELNAPARPETVYELASATKPLVATAIMLLVQDGKVNLEGEVSKHLEQTPNTWKGLTVRHLLTHTSGIKD
jgi:D-alanyl-D-alanine carboxypeptidase